MEILFGRLSLGVGWNLDSEAVGPVKVPVVDPFHDEMSQTILVTFHHLRKNP